jgi:hypothetical protein
MIATVSGLLSYLSCLLRPKHQLALEVLAQRHQIIVLKRQTPRPATTLGRQPPLGGEPRTGPMPGHTQMAEPVEGSYTTATQKLEHHWPELLVQASHFRVPIPRFGFSDYHSSRSSHLFSSERRPSFRWFQQRVRKQFDDSDGTTTDRGPQGKRAHASLLSIHGAAHYGMPLSPNRA